MAFIVTNLRHHLKKETPGKVLCTFHRELCSLVEHENISIAAPRGFAKSTFMTFFYSLYLLTNFPGIKITIVSATYFLSEYWANLIRRELETNEKIKLRFGDLKGDKTLKWTNELFELQNGSMLMSRGYGQQIRGTRPDVVILDDIETDEIVVSETRRNDFDHWFNEEVLGALLPGSRCVTIGTVLDVDSFLSVQLRTTREGWESRFYQAIMNGKSIWPEMWPLEALERKRNDIGSYAFEQEYMNNPIPPDQRQFQKKWIKYYKDLPRNVAYYAAVDLAIKVGDKNDFTAIIVVAMDANDNMYVVAYKRRKMLPKETVDQIFEYYRMYNIQKIGIEEVGFQEMLIHEIKDQRVERNLYPAIVPLKSGGKRKALRIEALQPRFECGKIFLKEGMDDLELELLRFPSPRCHDDLIDAMSYLLQIVHKASTPTTRQDPNTFAAILKKRRERILDEEYYGLD